MAETAADIGTVDKRQEAILGAARDAFIKHGFRRCTMEDIARGAGMSRAALYLSYRNKEDICRGLVARAYGEGIVALEAALATEDRPVEALSAGFRAKTSGAVEALADSPHAPELFERATAICGEMIAEGEARMVEIFANWLLRAAAAGRVDLAPMGGDAGEVARTITAALKGVKAEQREGVTLRAELDRLAVMLGRALTP